jgi:SRP-independent targeting protein 2/TMEM208
MYVLSATLAGWLQYQLEFVGRPTFDDRGGVIKTGDDLGQAGLTEYMFDILYLTWGIQLLVAFTTVYAWWLCLLVCNSRQELI